LSRAAKQERRSRGKLRIREINSRVLVHRAAKREETTTERKEAEERERARDESRTQPR